MKAKRTNDLGRDKISMLVLRLAVPTMIAQFVNVLYSIVDRIYIGNIKGYGDLALAGVGICGPIVTLLTSFGTLVGLGGAILLSVRLGEKNILQAKKILANSFLLLIILSGILTVLFLLSKDQLLMWFGASETTFYYANTYMTIYTIGTFFALMAIGLNYFINCQGFATVGMATVLIGAVANIVLDPIFIFAFDMGVSGAAIATVLSQLASCSFALTFLFSKKVIVKISFGDYSLALMKKIIIMGLSPFLILATDSVMIITMNAVLQKHGGPGQGDLLITSATIVQSYMLLITAPMLGISGGTQAILSYNYGAKQSKRVKDAEKSIVILCLIFTTIMFFISRFLPQYFVQLFTREAEVIELSIWGIQVFTMMIIPLSFQYCLVDGLTALERTKTALFLSMFRKGFYLLLTICLPVFWTAKATFYAEPIADIVASILSTTIFLLVIDRHLRKRELETEAF